MPIQAKCLCGKQYTYRDEFAGQQVDCPVCGQTINIPGERVPGVVPPRPAPAVASVRQVAATPGMAHPAAPARRGGKPRTALWIGLGIGGLVVTILVVGLLWQFMSSGALPKTPPADPASAALTTTTQPPATTAPAAATPADTAPATPAVTRTPDEILKPFLKMGGAQVSFNGTGLAWEEISRRMVMIRDLSTVRAWMNWLRTDPRSIPSAMTLATPFPKEQLLTDVEGKPDREEKAEQPSISSTAGIDTPLVWLQYQGVGFAVDEAGKVRAIRITAPLEGTVMPPEAVAPAAESKTP
jgi:hypothetical protein